MVLPHEFASAYAIFATQPISPSFFSEIVAQSDDCTIPHPDIELRIIEDDNFHNWTYEQLARWAASPEHFNNSSSPFQPCVFLVVDELSEQENSLVVVSLDKDDLSHILGTVRVDVCFAVAVPSLIEFSWTSIEEWQQQAQTFGGVLRDTPVEEEMETPGEIVQPGPNVWETDAGLSVATFSEPVSSDNPIWIYGVGSTVLRRRVVDGEAENIIEELDDR